MVILRDFVSLSERLIPWHRNMPVRSLAMLLLVSLLTTTATAENWPALPVKSGSVEIPAQDWRHRPGPRTVRVSIYYPSGTIESVTPQTGLMLTLHNWGGTDCAGTASPTALASRLNVVAICVNYLQSGRADSINAPEPYDYGYLQALDALRALHFVYDGLKQGNRKFDTGRVFATGGSGGGNVTQMCNKLAPRTFACVIDMCGMAKLSDDIAFNEPGGSGLNARWSRDKASPNYLSPAHQEIRFIGNPDHLAVLKRLRNPAKIIVVHGQDDRTCPFEDKVELVENMKAAGLDVEPHFLGKDDLDGKIFTSTGHPLGNRTEIVFKTAEQYLAPDRKKTSRRVRKPNDFERRDSIGFPVTGGEFVISYSRGYPVGHFIENNGGAWPPALPGAGKNGSVTLTSDRFLETPADVGIWLEDEGAASFVVAKTAPTVDLAFHQNLGPDAANRRLWSSWGDIGLASDGTVYCGIGDHGDDAGGDARCFVYRWSPKTKTLDKIVDMNQIVTPRPGQPAWSKVHAKIDEGADGKIYFCCTLNAGNRAGDERYGWTKELPGAQLYRFDPETGHTEVFANLPPKRCTATSLLDRERNIWWCNLEAGDGDALYGLDLATKKIVFQSKDGEVGFNRNFALLADGSILFNSTDGRVAVAGGSQKKVAHTVAAFESAKGMRASTREASDHWVYGSTHGTNQLFRFHTQTQKLELLGLNWLSGQYTTVMVLSPDERFLYYLPGAHGKAFLHGTPVIQYEIKTGTRKVLAFLAEGLKEKTDFVPGGTYGIKLSKDGGTLYVNFNGHAAEHLRPSRMKPIGFGLCAFAAIHIPESER
jgi:hypothetical protein